MAIDAGTPWSPLFPLWFKELLLLLLTSGCLLLVVHVMRFLILKHGNSCYYSTDLDAAKVKGQLKTLKCIMKALMLRRTKSKLIEGGNLVLPPLTEITVWVGWVPNFSVYHFIQETLSRMTNFKFMFSLTFIGWFHWSACKRVCTHQYWGRNSQNFWRCHLLIINLSRIL